jgi:hypothetical protein
LTFMVRGVILPRVEVRVRGREYGDRLTHWGLGRAPAGRQHRCRRRRAAAAVPARLVRVAVPVRRRHRVRLVASSARSGFRPPTSSFLGAVLTLAGQCSPASSTPSPTP